MPDGATGVLLFGHGGGHGKDSPRFVAMCRRYAEATGLAVVCIDAVDHGERKPAGVAPGIPQGWHSSAMPRMVEDWRRVSAAVGDIGPPVAYVGFSMGAIFGIPTVAALPTVRAAVLVVGGIPVGGGIDDAQLGSVLRDAAASLGERQVLFVNARDDDVFPIEGTLEVFDAIPGDRKRLLLSPGRHDDWSDEMIDASIAFLRAHV